jgi:hypothetical protein
MTHLNLNLPSLSGPSGAGTPPALATQLARRADANGDGQVSASEFDCFLTNLLQPGDAGVEKAGDPLDIVRRLLDQHRPTADGHRDLLAAIASALPGTHVSGTDALDVPGLGLLTIRAGAGPAADWHWTVRDRK